jgi:hypothetical protein
MRLSSLSAALSLAFVAAARAGEPEVNGWYPCGFTDPMDVPELESVVFECAQVKAPLCHADICDSDREIDLFVKRMLAASTPDSASNEEDLDQTSKSVWFLAGGPGASSASSTCSLSPLPAV